MIRKARIDVNQPQIVAQLRRLGCSVLILSQLKNCCDICVGYNGQNFLFEIKDAEKAPSARKLTDGEAKFFEAWHGQVNIITNFQDACQIIGISYI